VTFETSNESLLEWRILILTGHRHLGPMKEIRNQARCFLQYRQQIRSTPGMLNLCRTGRRETTVPYQTTSGFRNQVALSSNCGNFVHDLPVVELELDVRTNQTSRADSLQNVGLVAIEAHLGRSLILLHYPGHHRRPHPHSQQRQGHLQAAA
jgi:hypothetical protein